MSLDHSTRAASIMAGYAGYLDYSLDAVNRGQGREGCEREGGDRGKCVNA